jgi:hypothetical protein
VRSSRERHGFAAALAVCLLAALSGLAAASFYTVVGARRSANRSARQEQAASAADVALAAAVEAWDTAASESLAIGSVDSGRAYVIRLTNRIYWVTARGVAASGTSVEAGRIHNLLVEVLRPVVPARAAITSGGAVLAGPETAIVGGDSPPPEWVDCPPLDTAKAPPVLIVADSATYEALGRTTTGALAARADIVVPSGAILSPRPDVAGQCRRDDLGGRLESWGEPGRGGEAPNCEAFFPVIHAVGDLRLTAGRGQGVLLVKGRLRIDGPFTFHGVVIAAGGVEARGSDVNVYGTVLSADGRGVVWDATGQVRRSTCAVARASDRAARPYPVPRRGWAELF